MINQLDTIRFRNKPLDQLSVDELRDALSQALQEILTLQSACDAYGIAADYSGNGHHGHYLGLSPVSRWNGVQIIALERRRQVQQEGWTAEHDDQHTEAQLLAAAVCYLHNAGNFKMALPRAWPWSDYWWKPTGDRVRDLAKAGALIAAEIDRLQRKSEREIAQSPAGEPKRDDDGRVKRDEHPN